MTTEQGTEPGGAPRPIGPYRPVVRAGELLFVSGQLGTVDGELADGLAAQVTAALANLSAVLAGAGANLAQVVKTTVFLVDMADFEAMNEAYLVGFGDHRPARSAVAVAALPRGARVEIEAVAHLGR
ncbi:MAG TPA: Rid family detoxifying hydrolase [Acidimicrobiales bacterium]|jgi:2-iminobutanoate/2-iminopropanoate deaminase